MRSTTLVKSGEFDHRWVHVDASGQILGRLATRLATILMGKHRPTYTPHVDTGDYVVVTNAAGVRLTGKKAEQKVYRHHERYIGSLRERPFATLVVDKPEEVVTLAVRRMLPKTKMGRHMLMKLKVYRGDEHPHAAQKPTTLAI